MLQNLILNIKMNRAVFLLVGLLLILAGGLSWTFWYAFVNYRLVLDLNNFPKFACYALLLPILILWLLYPFLKRLSSRSSSREPRVSFMKRPISPVQVMGFIIFLAFFLISWGIVSGINCFFDGNPAHLYKVKVVTKQIRHTSRGAEYYILSVASWIDNDNKSRRIDLSRDEFDNIDVVPGDFVYVGIGKGALGIDWITSITKDPIGIKDKL